MIRTGADLNCYSAGRGLFGLDFVLDVISILLLCRDLAILICVGAVEGLAAARGAAA